MAQKILVVDDDRELCQALRLYLEQAGFEVVLANDGREALYVARYEKPDLIILDLMMPEMSGYEFMRIYGKESDTPVIMLTAKIEESDKVIGLELGADDYVTKPFGARELIARVRAVLRRMHKQNRSHRLGRPTETVFRAADIMLDWQAHVVKVGGRLVDLTPSEFDLLATLMAAQGRAFSRLELLERITGDAYEGYERTIDVHVRNLRAKIEPNPKKPRYIETVYGMGYRFAAREA